MSAARGANTKDVPRGRRTAWREAKRNGIFVLSMPGMVRSTSSRSADTKGASSSRRTVWREATRSSYVPSMSPSSARNAGGKGAPSAERAVRVGSMADERVVVLTWEPKLALMSDVRPGLHLGRAGGTANESARPHFLLRLWCRSKGRRRKTCRQRDFILGHEAFCGNTGSQSLVRASARKQQVRFYTEIATIQSVSCIMLI